MDKIYLFIITSIILGLIISYYYNNKCNKEFYIMFIMTTIIFFILFYFLGNPYDNYEKFASGDHIYYDSRHGIINDLNKEKTNLNQLQGVLNSVLHQEEEHRQEEYPYYSIKSEHHEENQGVYQEVHQEEEHHPEKHHKKYHHKKHYLEEEHPGEEYHKIHYQEEEHHYKKHYQEEEHPEEEHKKHKYPITLVPTDNKDKKISETISEGYGPININVSYNSQNSSNNLNDGVSLPDYDSSLNNLSNNLSNNLKKHHKSKNLGPMVGRLGNESRIYNNSDWVYGSNAWTNDPDYYIPTKNCPSTIVPVDPKPLNELAMNKLGENGEACPIEINVPWSQWQSGDSDPEPFNL